MIKYQRVQLGRKSWRLLGKWEVSVGQSRGGLVSEVGAAALLDGGGLELGGEGPILEGKGMDHCSSPGAVLCDLASERPGGEAPG